MSYDSIAGVPMSVLKIGFLEAAKREGTTDLVLVMYKPGNPDATNRWVSRADAKARLDAFRNGAGLKSTFDVSRASAREIPFLMITGDSHDVQARRATVETTT